MRYEEKYPNSAASGEGLIRNLSLLPDAPWADINPLQFNVLEIAYFLRSGFKELSAQFQKLPDEATARVIAITYFDKWRRYWELFKKEYDPLNAYIVNETLKRETGHNKTEKTDYGKVETKDITLSRESTEETKYGKTETVNGTDTGTVDNTNTTTADSGASVYGFNSTSAVPSEKVLDNTNETAKETRNLSSSNTQVDSGTDTVTSIHEDTGKDTITNSGEDNKTFAGTETEDVTERREGNIGYTTPQELMRQEFELWARPYFDIVFADIDNLITVMVY